MGTQIAPLQHHLPGATFGHFQETRGGNNKPQGKAGLSPCYLLFPHSSPNPSGGATRDQLDAPPVAGCPLSQAPPLADLPNDDGQRGQAAPRPPLQPATGQLSTEPQRATIILLTARGAFPDCWTHFLSLRIGKNLQSSKNGFQWALQVILKP